MTHKIAIIGSGNIGGPLGRHFAKAGHSVMFSSRHPEQLEGMAKAAGNGARAGTVEAAAAFGEVLLLAYPFGKTPEVAAQMGDLAGKVLIDANNYYPGRDGQVPGQQMQERELLESEWTASYFPGTHVVKAFNTIAAKALESRAFDQADPLAIPFSASSEHGQSVFESLLQDIGFAGVYLGDLSKSKITQPHEQLYTLQLSEAALRRLI